MNDSMNAKTLLISSGICLLVVVFWLDAKDVLDEKDNVFLVLYVLACALIAIGIRLKKSGSIGMPGDKVGQCPHCGEEGKNRDIFQGKGKDGKKLVMRCRSCSEGVYLDWNGNAQKIPPDEWKRIGAIDESLRGEE